MKKRFYELVKEIDGFYGENSIYLRKNGNTVIYASLKVQKGNVRKDFYLKIKGDIIFSDTVFCEKDDGILDYELHEITQISETRFKILFDMGSTVLHADTVDVTYYEYEEFMRIWDRLNENRYTLEFEESEKL